MTRVIGWDIGGAHLKMALVEDGIVVDVRQLACPLWLALEHLDVALRRGLAGWPDAECHAVTMTAELADLFPDRDSGVRAVLATLQSRVPPERIRVYASDGSFLSPVGARRQPGRVASANWHASAAHAAAQVQDGLLVDIGSSTTDLVPFRSGAVAATGTTDADRLASGELVYRGVVRTPVMAIAPRVRVAGVRTAVMAELFATSADVFRLTGGLPADADLQTTADGRGKSLEESRARLARMVGRDSASAPDRVWDALARQLAGMMLEEIVVASRRVAARPKLPRAAPVVGCGVGRFLARAVAKRLARPYRGYETLVSAADGHVAAKAADAAPAVAVALLAAPSSALRRRATAAGSSAPSRAPVVKAERKPRKSGASGSSRGRSARRSEPASPASSRRSRAKARKPASASGAR